jgi:hypothetical protein
MLECSGTSFFTVPDAVTGRLCLADKMRGGTDEGAKILLWNGTSELSDSLLSAAVGIVFTENVVGDALTHAQRLAEFRRLPSLYLKNGISAPLRNSIAILDSSSHRLFVDPDLETINTYFGARSRKKPTALSMILETNAPLSARERTHNGISISGALPNDASEDICYEYLCDVADVSMGTEIIATADMRDTEAFVRRVRAIYRAGVWGRFSLLCTSVSTPEMTNACISLLHEVFCMLDREAREFNGFIPKGILIDTPLMLLSAPKDKMLDFFVLDYERLRYLLTSCAAACVGESETARYLIDFADKTHNAKVFIRGLSSATNKTLDTLLNTDLFHGIYSPDIRL